MEPLTSMNPADLKRRRVRETVSREVPSICAISSCVRPTRSLGRHSLSRSQWRISFASFCGGCGEGLRLDFLQNHLARVGEGLRHLDAEVRMSLEHSKKIAGTYVLRFGRLLGLGGDVVFALRDDSREADEVTGLGDIEDEGASVRGTCRELHLAGAEDVDARRRFAFRA